jgi:4-carboxymuconolactone decarboxylase
MKKALFFAILSVTLSTQAMAQDVPIFPKGEISTADNHTGIVWLKELNVPDSILNFSLAHATFAPGAKLDWHIHPAGQYLLITEGTGYYQERGLPIQVVQKGEVIKCIPGVEHWHGATPDHSFGYLGATPVYKGKTKWLKRVTDEEYHSLKSPVVDNTSETQEILRLSKQKWLWMADRNIDSLNALFNEKAVFVHMGGNMTKDRELEIIKTGGIHYKHAEIQETSVQFIGNTAIVLNKIRLDAVVGGNEVTNPFTVTEVYVQQNGKWTLGSLSFTKLLTP